MKRITTTTAIILLTGAAIHSQDNTPLMKTKLKITNAYLFPGGMFQRNPPGALVDFQELAPKSMLLNQSYAGYTHSGTHPFSGGPFLSAAVGITAFNSEKCSYNTNPEIRLGIVYFSQTLLSDNYSRTDKKRYDTLTSSYTGQSFYNDSVTYKNYSMNYTTQQLRLDASIIYRTDPEARWSLFGGIGLEIGGSINAATTITYSEAVRIEAETAGGPASENVQTNTTNYTEEQFVNKNSWGVTAYVPVGIDFRIGKKREFFKRTHLYAEMRAGINYSTISESATTIIAAGTKGGIGLRVNF